MVAETSKGLVKGMRMARPRKVKIVLKNAYWRKSARRSRGAVRASSR